MLAPASEVAISHLSHTSSCCYSNIHFVNDQVLDISHPTRVVLCGVSISCDMMVHYLRVTLFFLILVMFKARLLVEFCSPSI